MKNNIIINGIDDIIKGLTTIKGAMLIADEKEILKELVAELLPELKETIHSDLEVQETVTEEPVEILSEESVTEELELDEEELEEVNTEESDEPYSRKELEAMSYNELKVLAGTVKGIDAKGKKQELIEKILNALGESSEEIEEAEITSKIKLVDASTDVEEEEEVENDEDEDDEDEDEEFSEEEAEEFKEFLSELELDELKSIAKEAGFKVSDKIVKVKLVEKLLIDLDLLVKCLESLGYYDDDEAIEEIMNDTESDKQKIVNKYNLDEYTVEELADICTEFDLSTKGKKQTLIDRIVKGVLEGTIEFEEDEEETTEEEEVIEEDNKKVESEEESEEVEIDPVVLAKEEEVEANIRAKYKSKKLKDSEIKKFLDKYTDGDPDCAGCKDCSKEDLLSCYIEIHRNLVDDEGNVSELEEPYIRNDEYYCCGVELSEDLDNDNMFCKICGQEYTD